MSTCADMRFMSSSVLARHIDETEPGQQGQKAFRAGTEAIDLVHPDGSGRNRNKVLGLCRQPAFLIEFTSGSIS